MPDTSTGSGGRAFPNTHWTLICDATDKESPTVIESIDHLAQIYWRPILAYFRRKWGRPLDEAKDLTQEFFLSITEKGFPKKLSPDQGRFRSYVMAALDNFVRQEHRRRQAKKRGGGRRLISFDLGGDLDPSVVGTPEQAFLRDWAACIMEEAVAELEEELKRDGKEKAFELLRMRDIEAGSADDVSYEELARRLDLSVSNVTHFLYLARKRLRELVLIRVRDTVTSDSEAEAELRELFGE